ncbi:MAG TPA: hypothetical protein VIQ74_08460 [Gemmatimonadaceae bacterium]|jgi:hypothetical protein
MSVDAKPSPFYAWLDHASIRELVRGALALPPGERLILIKGLIPSLIEDMGDAAVQSFLDELRTKAYRYSEAVAHPGEGGATRRTSGELLGGPVPGYEARLYLGGPRDPRRPGGRALERRWEAAAWEKLEGTGTTDSAG